MEIRERINHTIISGVKQRAQNAAEAAEEAARMVVDNPSPSPPGSPPGVRTGRYRAGMTGLVRITSESSRSVSVHIEVRNTVTTRNGHLLSDILEHGTGRASSRPHFQEIKDMAVPKIKKVFEAPYYG